MRLKETIKNEIQRRILEDYNGPDEHENETAQGACASILTYIDSLPEDTSFIEKRDQKIKTMMSKLTEEEKALLLSMQGGGFGGVGLGSSLLSLALAAGLDNTKKDAPIGFQTMNNILDHYTEL